MRLIAKDKIFEWRMQGMYHAYEEIKKNGLEAFEEELKMRQKYGVKALVSKKEMEEFKNRIVEDVWKITMIMAIATLQDEFDFTADQLNQFVRRFTLKGDSMAKDDVNFLEILDCVKEETGISVDFGK